MTMNLCNRTKILPTVLARYCNVSRSVYSYYKYCMVQSVVNNTSVTFLNGRLKNINPKNGFPNLVCRFSDQVTLQEKLTVLECVNTIQHLFEEAGVSESHQSAAFIVAHALGAKMLHKVRKQQVLTYLQITQIWNMTEKRLTNMPIQYVLGEWDFRDLSLEMQPPVFIPRPETEELVGHILESTPSTARFIEVGTGSGAIGISLLKERPNFEGYAFEAGLPAYNLTNLNAEKNGVSERLFLHNVPLTGDSVSRIVNCVGGNEIDFIVSNPPYILTKDMDSLQVEVRDFEDHNALHGGKDGLDVIRSILMLSEVILKKNGCLWLEVDSSHPPLVENLADSVSLRYVKTCKDFNGLHRFCLLTKM